MKIKKIVSALLFVFLVITTIVGEPFSMVAAQADVTEIAVNGEGESADVGDLGNVNILEEDITLEDLELNEEDLDIEDPSVEEEDVTGDVWEEDEVGDATGDVLKEDDEVEIENSSNQEEATPEEGPLSVDIENLNEANMKGRNIQPRGDSITTAVPLVLNGSTNGSISSSISKNFYKIVVPNGSSIQLDLTVTVYFDLVSVRIYDVKGTRIRDYGASWNVNTKMGVNQDKAYLDPGTYYIGIERYFVNYYAGTGNYSLKLGSKRLNNIDVSYDDTIASARQISLNTSFNGVMVNGEQSDMYRLDVSNAGIIDFKVTAYTENIYVRLYDANGNQLRSSLQWWNSNIGYSSKDYKLFLEKGTHYIQIGRYDDSIGNHGLYQVKSTYTDIKSNEKENNDVQGSANAIQLNTAIRGMIAEGDGSDFYKVIIPKSGKITIDFVAYIEAVYLELYDKNGKSLDYNYASWNSAVGYSKNKYIYSLKAGAYYVQIRRSYMNHKGNYKLSVNQNIAMKGNIIASVASKKTYTGKVIKPKVTVKYKNIKLSKGIDYTVSYKNNKKIGIATITIKGKGYYSGTITKKFRIIPKKTAIRSLKSPNRRQLAVKWKKINNSDGYEIAYADNSKFKKVKTIKIKSKNVTVSTLKRLKSGKSYYVKVRSYKVSEGKVYYSKYSKVKSIRVK